MSLQAVTTVKGGGGPKKTGQRKMGHKVTKTIKGPKMEVKQSPSSYLADMKLTTEEKLEQTYEMYPPKIIKLLDISAASHHKDFSLSIDQALFQPFPSEIIFQQFKPHQVYEVPLQLRNLDRVARHIKITDEESPYFSYNCLRAGGKVAPGMEVTYTVSFRPSENTDYEHELICITEREEFVIPIRAIGARGLLDFPDQISFNAAPVKHCSTKTILMRNVGNAETKLSIETTKPFSVTPSTAMLAANACMQVNVSYTPRQVSEHSAELVIHYSTGEKVYTKLYGSATDINVRLDRSSMSLDTTFVGLTSERSVLLHNRSNVVARYQWKAFSSVMEEDLHREILVDQIAKEEKLSKEAFYQRCMHNPSIRDRLPILNRTLNMNRKKYTDDERFMFFDECLVIDPLEGEVWPNSHAEISVIFCPDAATSYTRVAYCDVTGRESRLPLKIKGEGTGPKCQFSFDSLDVQNVFVNSAHAYEMIMENKGDIDAVYSVVPSSSFFGPYFTFSPSSGTLPPGHLQAIQISFCSPEMGEFNEEFQWQLKDSPVPLTMRIRGVVIGPTFQFDCNSIDFGTISCGFTSTFEVALSNTSEIPMSFCIHIPDEKNSSDLSTSESQTPNPPDAAGSKEFIIVPESGTLPPNFQQVIKVMFTPLVVQKYSTVMVLQLQEAQKEIFSLPVTAKSIVPNITLLTSLLDYKRCFLDHSYTLDAQLLNKSDHPVRYEVPIPPGPNQNPLVYSTIFPTGVINPHTTLKLPLEVKAKLQGEISVSAPIKILHSTEPPLEVTLRCTGEGPVVYVTPYHVEFGPCPVLTHISKTVTVSNQSIIPAEFACTLAQGKTVFTVTPLSARLSPNESLELTVTAFVDDNYKFSDHLNILVSRGVNFTIFLSIEGVGTTIISDPPLQPAINLGTYYSQAHFRRHFKLTNKGRRVQALSWITEGFSAIKYKRALRTASSRDVHDLSHKSKIAEEELKEPLFQIKQEKLVLEPFESTTITLHGISDIPQEVHERIVCNAIIGRNPRKERIMTVDVSATFIHPILEFTSKEVHFCVYQPPGSKLDHHSQELGVRNIGNLPVTAILTCPYPFCLIKGKIALAKMELQLEAAEKSTITILYDSTYCADAQSRFEKKYLSIAYKEHPQKDAILLKAEIHFPNLVFNKTDIKFGCILNDTERMIPASMTNNSPLPVSYTWYFIKRPPVRRPNPEMVDEGVDMESDHDSTSVEELVTEEEVDDGGDGVSNAIDDGDVSDKVDGELDGKDGASEGVKKLISSTYPPSTKDTCSNELNGDQSSWPISSDVDNSTTRPVSAPSSRKNSMAQTLTEEISTTDGYDEVACEEEEFSENSVQEDVKDKLARHSVHHVKRATEPAIPSILRTNLHSSSAPHLLGDSKKELRLGMFHLPVESRKKKKRKKKKKLEPWDMALNPFKPIPISQVFDILPLHGNIQPGATTQLQFRFYGHADITADVTAACKVDGGPVYKLYLSGEASKISYKFSEKNIKLGTVFYDEIQTAEIVLYNQGKVNFDFCVLGLDENTTMINPRDLMVLPSKGHVQSLESVTFSVKFLPGLPEKFSKSFEMRVAHFEPDVIKISGMAVFPTIVMNLPRDHSHVSPSIQSAIKSDVALPNLPEKETHQMLTYDDDTTRTNMAPESEESCIGTPPNNSLEVEIDRLLVKAYATRNAEKMFSEKGKSRPRISLPDYCMNFGYVVFGAVRRWSHFLVNTTHVPISLNIGHAQLEGSGFSVDIVEKVKSLPPKERLDFSVAFDPASVNLPEGSVSSVLQFNLKGGPRYNLRLSGIVTRPRMNVSSTQLDFGTVLCGQAKIITLRLSNPYHVKCDWTAITDKPPKMIPRHIPPHLRKKMREKPPPKYFEVEPASGTLPHGQTQDIRVRFMPTEETEYEDEIPFVMKRNSEFDLHLKVRGFGAEPQLEFDRTVVEFSPILPFSNGAEEAVLITNPTAYPIEFYSLEFDRQYLEDEEVLRWLRNCYDQQGRLFLPPYQPGKVIPPQVAQAYVKEMQTEVKEHSELESNDVNAITDTMDTNDQQQPEVPLQPSTVPSMEISVSRNELGPGVGSYVKVSQPDPPTLLSHLELPLAESVSRITVATGITIPSQPEIECAPLAAAIASHLGIDLSPEALLAENRRGIAIIVHGPHFSGKSTQAQALSETYNAAVFHIDDILIEAISSASTKAGRKARMSCIEASKSAELTDTHVATAKKLHPSYGTKESHSAKERDGGGILESTSTLFPPMPFSVDPMQESEMAAPYGTLLPTTLEEDIIVEILSQRFQQVDCRLGVIMDGIESCFVNSPNVTVGLILRAFNNRKHIYFVHLGMELYAIRNRMEEIEQKKLAMIKEEEEKRKESERLEEEHIAYLLDLEEDEYEALTDRQKEEIDTLRLKRKKIRRLQKRREKEEKERLEQARKEEEERLKEASKKKGKKAAPKTLGGGPLIAPVKSHHIAAAAQPSRPTSVTSGILAQPSLIGGFAATSSKVSVAGSIIDSNSTSTPTKNKPKKGNLKVTMEPNEEQVKVEKLHNYYKLGMESLRPCLDDWDRQKLEFRRKPQEVEEQKPTPSRRSKAAKHKEQEVVPQDIEEESREGLGLPFIDIDTDQSASDITKQILNSDLPSLEDILEGMGMGHNGPPIPEPAIFQVCPFPLKRRSLERPASVYTFITASLDDPNGPVKEEAEKSTPELEEIHEKEKKVTSSSRVSRRGAGSTMRNDTAKLRKKGSSRAVSSPQPPVIQPVEEQMGKEDEEPISLIKFRWIVPAGGTTKLKLLFKSFDKGKYDSTLNFEIVGTRRRYQLFCRGLCTVPSICREPRIVFPNRKKKRNGDEIIQKRFVISENTYHFGPLHCGKTRDRFKEGRYPENMESITISNTSMMETEVSFYFLKDSSANTYLLDPPFMTLLPGESKTLNMWAYPKSIDKFEDALLCCVKNNPDPIQFKLCCYGAEPELKVDKKVLEFKKVLLHRKQTNVVHLSNQTMLPVAWKLNGIDALGDEFSFSQDHGIVQPLSEFPLCVHFRSPKQVHYSKKAFKIEVSDVQQIMGLMHVETVQITAEAYDVAIDVSFPRGTDGGLDFQCMKACDEHRLVIQMKNKGKYDVAYNFKFDNSLAPKDIDCSKIFYISPSSSTLYPSEKPQNVAIIFKMDKEMEIKNLPILKCQVIDIHLGDKGEVIANIPIRISARSVFARPAICPIDELNFGSMILHSKKQCIFTIQNRGVFDFKFAVNKQMTFEQQKQRTVNMAAVAAKNRAKSRERLGSPKTSISKTMPKTKSDTPLRTEVLTGPQKLILGMFSINPAFGSVAPGQYQVITVDCIADKPGTCEELLSVEISDRPKDSAPLHYELRGEVLVPGINTTDTVSIFEEHRVCRQLGVLGQYLFHEEGCVGVYGEEERRFVFKSVIVGQSSKARFKINNPGKIPSEVIFTIKTSLGKSKSGQGDRESIFDVEPSSKVLIAPHSFVYATVTFHPSALQTYSAIFEAAPDFARAKSLSFDIQGEGNLPQISVIRPIIRNSKNNYCMLFRRLSLHHCQYLPLTLKNTGTIPATVTAEITNGFEVFHIIGPSSPSSKDEKGATPCTLKPVESTSSKLAPPPPPELICLVLAPGETAECHVKFMPDAVQKYKGKLRVSIMENMFEKFPIQLVGEGCEEDVSIDNVRGQMEEDPLDHQDLPEDDIEANRATHIYFGNQAVGESRQIIFKLSNLSRSNMLKFQWPTVPSLQFIPSIGHIRPNASKDITITFKANKPHSFEAKKILGKAWHIKFTKPLSEVPDWDDRLKSVQWVNVASLSQPSAPSVVENISSHSVAISSSLSTSIATAVSVAGKSPAKKKVIETEKEPLHSEVEDSQRDLELFMSGIADFCKYECSIREIKFRDTLMYQTRAYTFPLKNTGQIDLNYQWSILKENESAPTPPPIELRLDENRNVIDEGGEVVPFSIMPTSGTIPPDGEAPITVQFSPLGIADAHYLLQCHIPYLDVSCSPLVLPIEGKSLMPFCHFELEPSDYLNKRGSDEGLGSTNVEMANIRVIEFEACRVGLTSTRKFFVVNPTKSSYEYIWSTDDVSLSKPIRCLTMQGVVQAGKKHQMVFEYQPTGLDVVESLWNFSIPSLSLANPFLLVGQTLDPSVMFDRCYLSFKTLLIGFIAKETVYLINNESLAYNFSFTEQSLYSESHSGRLKVNPMTGVIPPNSRIPVVICFSASQEKDYSFALKCNIKRKVAPLLLKVKAEGYSVNVGLSYSTPEGSSMKLPVGRSDKRSINFGQVMVNDKTIGQLTLHNLSLYSFEYHWEIVHQSRHRGVVSFEPQQGKISANNKEVTQLQFLPTTKMTLKNCQLILEISNGPSLPITLEGSAVEPSVLFSFEEYNFGPSILHRPDMPVQRKKLQITNSESKEMSVHCFFKTLPHLDIQFKSCLLAPGEETYAVLEFKPQNPIKYSESVIFEINGFFRKTITVKGEGSEMRLELANPAQKIVNFGALQISSDQERVSSSKTVKLVNRSPTALSLSLSIVPSSSVPALQKDGTLSVEPSGEISLKANSGSCDITITFNPKCRVPQFSEEVTMECLGLSQPLLVVTGCCQGLEVNLDTEHIPFGAVVQDSSSTRKLLMLNTGDIGGAFHWNAEAFAPEFSISPKDGYISSGMELTFDVEFHPTKLDQDIRKPNLLCVVEGRGKPLKLTLSGICIEKIPFKDTLQFVTTVRTAETRHLTIQNKTSTHWRDLHPTIDGQYWTGPDTISVEANQSSHYELTYHPLEMASEQQKHYGSIFFPTPDGNAQFFHLSGVAEPPKPVKAITQEVPCKTPRTEPLTVENWLRRPQRFVVIIEPLKAERLDESTLLYGLNYIDVPGLGKKDYQLHFKSFKECNVPVKVTFKNEETGEYLFYMVTFKATPAGVIETINLTSQVRRSVTDTISITNPLRNPVTMTTMSNVPDVTLPSNFIIGAENEGKCMFEYLPLKVGETTGKLTLHSSDLGTYQYELHLTATPCPHEKPIHFTANLGGSQHHTCRFISYARGRTDYISKVDSNDFVADKSITVASSGGIGTEASTDVTFEPSHLGDTQALLTISSLTGGDYVVPLFGHCLPPKPQGPYTIRSGSYINIQFKNIFHQLTQFKFTVDHPAFTIKTAGDSIKPRRNYNINVSYDGRHGHGLVKVGKLTVTSLKVKGTSGKPQRDISWVYYLRGQPQQ